MVEVLTGEELQKIRARIGETYWRKALAIRREAQLANHPPPQVETFFLEALDLGVQGRMIRDRLAGIELGMSDG